jgi:hypothetical protein
MKERIRLLAEQTHLTDIIQEHHNEFGHGDIHDYSDLEKFAELIVRECADVCQQFGNGGSGYTLSSEIREHFGVKL